MKMVLSVIYHTMQCSAQTKGQKREGQRKDGGVSLNDRVLPGPALQPNLASVIIRFRITRIGLMADVEKMFL